MAMAATAEVKVAAMEVVATKGVKVAAAKMLVATEVKVAAIRLRAPKSADSAGCKEKTHTAQ